MPYQREGSYGCPRGIWKASGRGSSTSLPERRSRGIRQPGVKRLELSPNTIAKSRSDGIGSTLAKEFRKNRQRGANAAAPPLGF
jgi:hypothetical protein